jgi:hypothetical protein
MSNPTSESSACDFETARAGENWRGFSLIQIDQEQATIGITIRQEYTCPVSLRWRSDSKRYSIDR